MRRDDPGPAGAEPVVRFTPGGLRLGQSVVPLRSAGFRYWGLPPDLWGDVLDGARTLQIPIVSVDVPWSLHEPAPGVFDWGEVRPERRLDRALRLAHARGLQVLVRPGPWLTGVHGGGIPSWLLAIEGASSLSTSGRRLPIPTYGSEGLERAVRRWLGEVFERIRPHRFPLGPVVGCLLGDVAPAPAPWPGGALDRSVGSEQLAARYRSVKYGGAPADPKGGPGGPQGVTAAVDRVEAGEIARRLPLGWALEARAERGAGAIGMLVEVRDVPAGSGGDPRAAGDLADGVVLELPEGGALDYTDLRLMGLRASSLRRAAGVSRLASPSPLEISCADLDLSTAAAVLSMSGVRALEIDSLVPSPCARGGEHPLGVRGRLTPSGERLRDLFRLLDAIEHPTLERRTSALLLVNREVARLRESRAGHLPLPASLAAPRVLRALRIVGAGGEEERPELDHEVLFDALFDGLRRIGVPLSVSDTSIAADELDRARVAFLVGFDRMSRPLAQRCFEWVADGGTLVLGPRAPIEDWAGAPLRLSLPLEVKERRPRIRLGGLVLEDAELYRTGEPVIETRDGVLATACPLGRGRLIRFGFRLPFAASAHDPETLGWLVARLCGAAEASPCYASSDPIVETELFEGEVRRFLFMANPAPDARMVTVALGEREAIREVRGSGEHVRAGEALSIPARTVLLREIVRL